MPGQFIDDVHMYQCGTHTDGTAIMCSEITFGLKIPFVLPQFRIDEIGWREAGKDDVHIPLELLIAMLKRYGMTVSYDEEELQRKRNEQQGSGAD